jgi:hypothetical protein
MIVGHRGFCTPEQLLDCHPASAPMATKSPGFTPLAAKARVRPPKPQSNEWYAALHMTEDCGSKSEV